MIQSPPTGPRHFNQGRSFPYLPISLQPRPASQPPAVLQSISLLRGHPHVGNTSTFCRFFLMVFLVKKIHPFRRTLPGRTPNIGSVEKKTRNSFWMVLSRENLHCFHGYVLVDRRLWHICMDFSPYFDIWRQKIPACTEWLQPPTKHENMKWTEKPLKQSNMGTQCSFRILAIGPEELSLI